jgi:bloom syndrome protein
MPRRSGKKEAMWSVIRFCDNRADCRRTAVLAFFNEKFNPALCRSRAAMSASTTSEQKLVREDVTDGARQVIQDDTGL